MKITHAALCTWSYDDAPEHFDVCRSAMDEFVRREGWTSAEYFDVVPAGEEPSLRPKRDELMDAVRDGRVGAVVVESIGSIAESHCHLATLIEEFAAHDVRFLSLEPCEHLDTATPEGRRFVATMREAFPAPPAPRCAVSFHCRCVAEHAVPFRSARGRR